MKTGIYTRYGSKWGSESELFAKFILLPMNLLLLNELMLILELD